MMNEDTEPLVAFIMSYGDVSVGDVCLDDKKGFCIAIKKDDKKRYITFQYVSYYEPKGVMLYEVVYPEYRLQRMFKVV